MKNKAKKLGPTELKKLTDRFQVVTISSVVDLVYEDQIPNTGVILIEGEAVLIRKKRIIDTIIPGTVLGVYQLLNNERVRSGCRIRENSKVILLQKSEILELLKDNDSPLRRALLVEDLLSGPV